MLLAAATKNVVDADDALWLAAGAVFVDESRLGQHPDVAAMLSQKAVLPCLTLALGEHGDDEIVPNPQSTLFPFRSLSLSLSPISDTTSRDA